MSQDGEVESAVVKRVRLTRKTRPRLPVHSRPDPGLPTPKQWKKLHLLPNPQESGVKSACLPTFFLALGLVEIAAGDAWNLHREAASFGFSRLVSPAEGVSALALARGLISCAYMRLDTHHNHHTPPRSRRRERHQETSPARVWHEKRRK